MAPVASGVPSSSVVITQQGAHLRQPCLLQSPGSLPGVWGRTVRWVPWFTGLLSTTWGITSRSHGSDYIHSRFPQQFSFSFSLSSLHRMGGWHSAMETGELLFPPLIFSSTAKVSKNINRLFRLPKTIYCVCEMLFFQGYNGLNWPKCI